MNIAVLQGRLTKDPDVRYSQDQMCVTTFTMAVDRNLSREKRERVEQTADFIRCIAFGRGGEVIGKYFTKGNRILINGHIQTGSYKNKEGQMVYTTDVVVDRFDFIESRSDNRSEVRREQNYTTRPPRQDEDIPDGFAVIDESEIPF